MQAEVSSKASRRSALGFAALSGVFGLLGPAFLSIYWADRFRVTGDLGHGYPWSFAAWSYSITALKMAALVAWLIVRGRWSGPGGRGGRGTRFVGALSGVLLIGGLHALACATCNFPGLGEGPWIASHVYLAFLSALIYLWNFALAALWVIHRKAAPLPGFALGLVLAVGLPALAEWAAQVSP